MTNMNKAYFQRRYHLVTLVCGIVLGALGSIFQISVQGGWAAGSAGWPLRWYSYTDVGPSQTHSWLSLAADAMAVVFGVVVLCELFERLLARRSP
jgi:hypothetical protein